MDTAQLAIDYALQGKWTDAIDVNLDIIKNDSENIEALNRLSRAYVELGDIKNAQKTAEKVLTLDSINSIALKCLSKCKVLKNGSKNQVSKSTTQEDFLEIPGKTKIVELLHLGDNEILACLDSGDVVNLVIRPHRVSVVTLNGKYIGRFPDDLTAKFKHLSDKENEYRVIIKSATEKSVKVFIHSNTSLFPTEKIEYTSFTPPELVHKDTPMQPNLETSNEAFSEL